MGSVWCCILLRTILFILTMPSSNLQKFQCHWSYALSNKVSNIAKSVISLNSIFIRLLFDLAGQREILGLWHIYDLLNKGGQQIAQMGYVY